MNLAAKLNWSIAQLQGISSYPNGEENNPTNTDTLDSLMTRQVKIPFLMKGI